MKKFILLLLLIDCAIFSNAQESHNANSDNSTEYTEADSSKCSYSGTLPVLFINTADNAPIVSKEEYLKATCYLDILDLDNYEALGSKDSPINLQIKGRGNASWLNSDKKPYRIKFDKKQEFMGMSKNKHFTLIAHVGSYTQFLTEATGFELGKMIGLAWTPEMAPLELVVNDEYLGIYFLTEHIRIDENRVNIYEQSDSCTNPDEITGGWLVEIDNYTDPYQIVLEEGNGSILRITHKSPEVLSPEQENYLRTQMTSIDSLIYSEDKNSTLLWDKYIDLEYLAKYYIVQEILDNADAFHGSTYMHKNIGEDEKWIFGPLWDLGYSFWRDKDFLYQGSKYATLTWIAEIAKFPSFQEKVKEIWAGFYPNISEIYNFIDDFASLCIEADKADAIRWPQYNKGDTNSKRNKLKNMLQANIDWLNSKWDVSGMENIYNINNIKVERITNQLSVSNGCKKVALYNLMGGCIILPKADDNTFTLPSIDAGIYIIEITTLNDNIYKQKLLIQ